jgi:hypothetical protein
MSGASGAGARGPAWAAALAFGAGLPLPAGAVAPGTRAASPGLLPEPRALAAHGPFAHPSGFEMPIKVGPFGRVELFQCGEAGVNLSAGYNALVDDPAVPVVATVYVYPRRGRDLDGHFDEVLDDVARGHDGARPEFRTSILLAGRHPGRYAFFGYAEPWGGVAEDVPLRSYVVLYAWEDWWVKWRVTTPAPVSDERMRAIVELTETLLPPTERSAPPRSSHPSTDLDPRTTSTESLYRLSQARYTRSAAPRA